jgi:hypothetical protein
MRYYLQPWVSGGRPIDTSEFHPGARALWDYWQTIHPASGLPGRQHFDPGAVIELLPNLVLVEVHREPLRFRYRLVGSRVDAVNRRGLSGKWLDEAYADQPAGKAILDEYARVAETGLPTWRRGETRILPDPDCRIIEVLRLPLASNATTVDMVLGITLYFDSAGRPFIPPGATALSAISGGAAEIRAIKPAREPPGSG